MARRWWFGADREPGPWYPGRSRRLSSSARHSGIALLALLAVVVAIAPAALPASADPTRAGAPLVGQHVVARLAVPRRHVAPADTKTSCIYASMGRAIRRAQGSTGIRYSCVEVFNGQDLNWAQWSDPWLTNARYGYTQWLAAAPKRRTVVIAQNLVPDDVAKKPNWRAIGAEGGYDRYARALARTLVKYGFGHSVIRLGPEMNGPWEIDWIGTTPTQQRQWALYFARIVRVMRRVRGADFIFDWNVNAGYEDIPLANFYPGDAAVSVVGIDAYDEAPIPLPPVGTPDRWSTLVGEPLGLDEIAAFAAVHHKPLSIPEWGTLSTHGDDGNYVAEMGRFVATHDVAYQCWYDTGDNNILELNAQQAPRSLAAYIAAFGAHSPVARYQ